jgi:serine/threonine protein kinase
LPRVSDHFSEGDGQFLVMQYIPGDDLSEMMAQRRGPFQADQVLTWADQLLDALDYLHTQEPQIIHRDIKPQNLKLTSRGQIILLDFGLAKGQAGEISKVTTAASIFGYTPNYAPLEQIQGLGTDSRSDLYSLAATIYHLLTGTKPPDALTRAAALVNGQPDPLTPATELNPAVAPEVSEVLQQAMAQNRDQRFVSAAEMRKALHRTEQTSTIINRGEAQTMLREPAAPTFASSTVAISATPAAPTKAAVEQKTVATGETTVVRPFVSTPKRNVIPWVLSGVALLVAACVLGFYMMQKKNDAVVQLVPTSPSPTPESSPSATAEPTVSPTGAPSPAQRATPEPKVTTEAKQPKKTETAAPTPEPKKQSTPNVGTTAPPQPETGGHEAETVPSTAQPPRIPNRPKGNIRVTPNIQVGPGGIVIRNYPDGSKVISSPDGSRILVYPDGRRQVIQPGQRPRQQRPSTP